MTFVVVQCNKGRAGAGGGREFRIWGWDYGRWVMEDIEEHAIGIALEAGGLIIEASKKRLAHGSVDSVEEKKNCMQ